MKRVDHKSHQHIETPQSQSAEPGANECRASLFMISDSFEVEPRLDQKHISPVQTTIHPWTFAQMNPQAANSEPSANPAFTAIPACACFLTSVIRSLNW